MLLSYDLITFQILGQKSVKFFGGFLENLKFQKVILKLSDLYCIKSFVTYPESMSSPHCTICCSADTIRYTHLQNHNGGFYQTSSNNQKP